MKFCRHQAINEWALARTRAIKMGLGRFAKEKQNIICMHCYTTSDLYVAVECGAILCIEHANNICKTKHVHRILYRIQDRSLYCAKCRVWLARTPPLESEEDRGNDAESLDDQISFKRFLDIGQPGYVNAVLHILLGHPYVRRRFLSFHHCLQMCPNRDCPDCFVKKIYSLIFSPSRVDLTEALGFMRKRAKYHFPYRIKTIPQLYNLITHAFHPLGVPPPACRCIFHPLFFGIQSITYECMRCHDCQTETTEFNMVQLKYGSRLLELVQKYFSSWAADAEKICEHCDGTVARVLGIRAIRMPQVLCIELQKPDREADSRQRHKGQLLDDMLVLDGHSYALYSFIYYRGRANGCYIYNILMKGKWYEFDNERIIRSTNLKRKMKWALVVFYTLIGYSEPTN